MIFMIITRRLKWNLDALLIALVITTTASDVLKGKLTLQASGSFTAKHDHETGITNPCAPCARNMCSPSCNRQLGVCYSGVCNESRFDEVSQQWLSPRPELQPETYEQWDKKHLEDMSNLENAVAHKTIVLLGDSITENWARSYDFERKSPVTGKGLLTEGVVPFAIGGDRIQDLAYRLFELGGAAALQKLSPTTVIVTIGANDFLFGEDVAIAEKEMEMFVQQLQSALPAETHLALQRPLPQGRYGNDLWDDSNPAYRYFNHLNAVLQRQAHGKSKYVDCTSVFLQEGHRIDIDAFAPDKVHFSRIGYQRWGSCMEQRLAVSLLKATALSGICSGRTIHVSFALIAIWVASYIVDFL